MTYDLNKAFLADAVYSKTLQQNQTITSSDGSQWTAVQISPQNTTGYQGALFKNEATGQYVFASRGTDITSTKDLGANLQMGLQQTPDQMAVQREFFQEVKKEVLRRNGNPDSITLTGHSLGGALIQALAAENPANQADTFNAYGPGNLIPGSEGKVYNNITNHVMHLDGVSVLPGSQMIGNTVAYGTANSLDHLLSSFMENLTGTALVGASLAAAYAAVAAEGITSHLMSNFLNPELAASTGTPITVKPSEFGEQLLQAMDSTNANVVLLFGVDTHLKTSPPKVGINPILFCMAA
jgi:hypothetical protein